MSRSKSLGRDDRELIGRIVKARTPTLMPLVELLGHKPLSQEDRENLRGVLAAELSERGLDEKDEPNEWGRRMEALIDLLGHL